jgi:archaellum biogenesis ATPase FlaH
MNIIEFLSRSGIHTNLKEKNNVYIECPKCHGDNLSINVFSGVWQCWNAQCAKDRFSGNFEELMRVTGINIPVGERLQFSEPPRNEAVFGESERNAIHEATKNTTKIIEWSLSRGLDPEFVLSLGIGYDEYKHAVVFPFRNERSELIGARYKSLTAQWTVGKEPKLYLLDPKDLKSDKIIIVEGEVDAITLKQFRLPVVATLGAGKTKGFGMLTGIKTVYLGYDMDAAGEAGVESATKEFGSYRCKRITWGAKDPNDWLQAGMTKELLVDAIKSAKTLTQETNSLNALSALNIYFEEHEKGAKPRRSWGYGRLDSFTKGIGGGTLIGVLAESGTGKTTFILNIIRNFVYQGFNCGIASLEEHPINEITPKLCSCMLGKNIATFGLSRDDAMTVEADIKRVQLYNKAVDLQSVIDWVRECYYAHDVKMVAIDYFQLLVKDEESVQDIKQTMFSLKNLVVEMPELCVFLVIQPKQLETGLIDFRTGKPYPKAKMDGSKARGGSAINQTVDYMLTIKAVENHSNLTQYEYTKVRGHLVANKSDWQHKVTHLEYNHDTQRMVELANPYYGA